MNRRDVLKAGVGAGMVAPAMAKEAMAKESFLNNIKSRPGPYFGGTDSSQSYDLVREKLRFYMAKHHPDLLRQLMDEYWNRDRGVDFENMRSWSPVAKRMIRNKHEQDRHIAQRLNNMLGEADSEAVVLTKEIFKKFGVDANLIGNVRDILGFLNL